MIISISVLMLLSSPIPGQGAEQKKPQLCQGNYQSEEEAKEQLARFAQSYSDLEQWKEHPSWGRTSADAGKVPAQADYP